MTTDAPTPPGAAPSPGTTPAADSSAPRAAGVQAAAPPPAGGSDGAGVAVSPLPGLTGVTIAAGANHPLYLDDPSLVHVMRGSGAEVFAVTMAGGAPTSQRFHLFRATQPTLLLGRAPTPEGLAIVVVGSPDTVIERYQRADVHDLRSDPARAAWLGPLVAAWIEGFGSVVSDSVPPIDVWVDGDQPIELAPGQVAASRLPLAWVTVVSGSVMEREHSELTVSAGPLPIPLVHGASIRAAEPTVLQPLGDGSVFASQQLMTNVDAVTDRVVAVVGRAMAAQSVERHARFDRSQAADAAAMEASLRSVAAVLEREPTAVPSTIASGRELLFLACQAVGGADRITMTRPTASLRALAERDPIVAIANASRVRYRPVTIPAEWWKGDHGPLLAFREPPASDDPPGPAAPPMPDQPADAQMQTTNPATLPGATGPNLDQPVALLRRRGGYTIFDPATGRHEPANRRSAAGLQDAGFTFYRPFVARSMGLRDLLTDGFGAVRADLGRIALYGAGVGLLSLAVPIATGVLFSTVIPAGEIGLLVQIGLALTVAALAAGLFTLAQNIAILRFSGIMSYDLQAAVWDRLLALPMPFFRDYSSGDLVARAMGVDIIRQILSGVTVSSLLGVAFSSFSLALLFVFSVPLGFLALLLVALVTVATVGLGLVQVRYNREMYRVNGRIYGLLYQYLESVDKLRIAGAEMRAFARWADQFRAQKAAGFSAGLAANGLTTINASFGIVSSLALFSAAAADTSLAPASFLAFAAAYGQFVAATQQVNYSLISALSIIPLYERLAPILQAVPEVDPTKRDPGVLRGRVAVEQLSFRYGPDGPLVLQNVSFEIEPGEFVAIVGPSGSGKTSLLRLLLGFESTTTGTISYDGQDLRQVDVRRVRQQLGVVLQDGKPMAGDLFHNIVGSSQLGLDDAWTAASLAGIADDIKRMPMGMFTYVPEGGGTFSGGQLQRILLARALVGRPRILLMDEATSALDNVTQAGVIASIRSLRSTVIMIAERLSTIQHADRILVFDQGKLVESGTYADLLAANGTFTQLAQRQLL